LPRDLIDYFVLDALANDLESLDDIVRLLNSDRLGWRSYHAAPFERIEVVPALFRGITNGLIRVAVLTPDGRWLTPLEDRVLPSGDLDEAWFSLTPHGQMVHLTWEPPPARSESGEASEKEAT
jgi:hypothetical protein